MSASEGPIFGVTYLNSTTTEDERGSFTKVFSALDQNLSSFSAAEVFYSESRKGVIRGMHLQVNDSENERLILIASGLIQDVLLDLRPKSATYLNFQSKILSPRDTSTVYVPAGVAHGFLALEDSVTFYLSSKEYDQQSDKGIDSLSCGIHWNLNDAIRSPRDQTLPKLSDWIIQAKW
jgi:dTDP-4-dehydrorhamnose 3,5-epimerase